MISIVKWEVLKWYYRLRWVIVFAFGLLGVFTLLALMGVFNDSNFFIDAILTGVSGLFLCLMFLLWIIIPSCNMIMDYILPYKSIEWMTKRRCEAVIFVKMIVNGIMFCLGDIIGLSVNLVFKNLIANGQTFFSIGGDKGAEIVIYLIFGIIVPIIVLFFFMLTYCIKSEIKHRILVMLIIMGAVFGGLYLISKMVLINRLFGTAMMIAIMLIITNITGLIESKYEPQ